MSRKKISHVLFLMIALGTLVPNLLSSGKELQEIKLEEVLSIGSLDDDLLFQWVGVAADSEGNIYVTDAMDYSLKKFNPQGKLIKKAGGKGQGPGEFMAPRSLGCSQKYLYAVDQHLLGLHVFDMELNFVRRIPLEFPVDELKVVSDSQLAVSTISINRLPRIYIFDSEGKLVKEIIYYEKILPIMMDMISFDFDSQDDLFLAYTYQDKIEKLSQCQKKLWTIRLFKGKKSKRKKVASYVIPEDIIYKDVILDRKGNLFVLGGDFSKNNSRDVYVISSEGKHLTTFTLPEASHCLYIDSHNFLYSRAGEGVTIKKYRMHYVYR